jgi:hypothetical protein
MKNIQMKLKENEKEIKEKRNKQANKTLRFLQGGISFNSKQPKLTS